jgi:hypothetical protein
VDPVDALLEYCRADGRVCPMPTPWNTCWELLPARRRTASGGWEPALPLILAAWADSSAAEKRHRLQEHIEWAAKHGALEIVARQLRGLDERQWLHVGEWPA